MSILRVAMPRKRPAVIVTLVATLLIMGATLTPSFGPLGSTTKPCLLLCGERGLADFVNNILLYAPLGIGLCLLGMRARGAILSALLLSTAIELAQIPMPGRDSSPSDVLANILGAAIAFAVSRVAAWWLAPTGRRAGGLLGAWATLIVVATGSTGYLVQPSFPSGEWYGQWTPRFGHLERYEGRLVGARVGPLATPSRRNPRSDSLRALVLAGTPLVVGAVVGHAPPALAPIFSIADESGELVLLIGADGDDLVFSYRQRARDVLLDAPSIRLRDWLAGITPGDTVTIRTQWTPAGICIGLDARRACGLGFTVARGWALLFWLARAPGWLVGVLDTCWVAGLFLPLGLWVPRGRTWPGAGWAAAAAMAVGTLLVLPGVVGLRPSGVVDLLGVTAGCAAGLVIRRATRLRREIP